MDQQPDKLFRDKLHRYQGTVSPHAWERISTNVGKTSTRSLWLKIAASMLILLAAGVLIFSWRQEPNEPIAEKAVAPAIRKSPSSDERIEEIPSEKEEAAILPKDIASSEGQKVARKEQKVVTPTEQPPSPGVSEDLPVLAVISPEEIENTATSVDEVVDVVDADAVSNGVTTQQSTTIVFSAEEVNEKYLTDKPVAEATSEAKESSTLRKLLDKAYDLKNNQDPIGDLRQKKNEILAMNFKHQKQRDENN